MAETVSYYAGKMSQVAKKRFRSIGGTPEILTKKERELLTELYSIERDSVEWENRLHTNWEGKNEVPSAKAEVEAGFPCDNSKLKISPLGWMSLLTRAENSIRVWKKQLADLPIDDQCNEDLVRYRDIVKFGISELEKWLGPVSRKSQAAFNRRTEV